MNTVNIIAARALQADRADVAGPTVQSDVTASRAIGTVYQNTTGKPKWLTVIVNSTVAYTTAGLTDSSNPPTTIKYREDSAASNERTLNFIVLPNNYCKVTVSAGTPSLIKWIEDD